jgi:hypothetical protein
MTANLEFLRDAINGKAHRRENNFMYGYKIIFTDKGRLFEPVDLRIYGTNARNYACIWIAGKGRYGSGSAWAGEYGYHRPSAAAEKAIKSAGIKLSQPIDGAGNEAIESAIMAIAKAIYPRRKMYLIRVHG